MILITYVIPKRISKRQPTQKLFKKSKLANVGTYLRKVLMGYLPMDHLLVSSNYGIPAYLLTHGLFTYVLSTYPWGSSLNNL
jgi:hypothetical protein